MFNLFNNKQSSNQIGNFKDFDYLDRKALYFDSSCQTLRPQQVIDAEVDYYQNFNSCGHRVKYKWGEKTDNLISATRDKLIKSVGKNNKDYTVVFCLNATAGINLVLHQLDPDKYEQIITSEIEHSSVFLPSLTWSQNNQKPRKVLARNLNGSLIYDKKDLAKAIVVLNSTNNFDGTNLLNAIELSKDVREKEGVLLIDACQTMGHHPEMLKDVDFDAAMGSGHKMYGPSIGFVIIKKSLIGKLKPYLIGGSTIADNQLDSYQFIDDDEELYSRLEPGLQNFAGIIGLGEAISWREKWRSSEGNKASEYEQELSKYLWQKVQDIPNIEIINQKESGVISLFPIKGIDSNRLILYLSEKNIMCRTGYHCVYYYLLHLKKYPQLFRVSLGLNNTKEQIDELTSSMKIILENV